MKIGHKPTISVLELIDKDKKRELAKMGLSVLKKEKLCKEEKVRQVCHIFKDKANNDIFLTSKFMHKFCFCESQDRLELFKKDFNCFLEYSQKPTMIISVDNEDEIADFKKQASELNREVFVVKKEAEFNFDYEQLNSGNKVIFVIDNKNKTTVINAVMKKIKDAADSNPSFRFNRGIVLFVCKQNLKTDESLVTAITVFRSRNIIFSFFICEFDISKDDTKKQEELGNISVVLLNVFYLSFYQQLPVNIKELFKKCWLGKFEYSVELLPGNVYLEKAYDRTDKSIVKVPKIVESQRKKLATQQNSGLITIISNFAVK